MKKVQQILTLAVVTLMAPLAQAALVNFHFGTSAQTGGAALGGAGSQWNANDNTNGGPVLLKDSTGAATTISVSWTSNATWVATKPIKAATTGTLMDAATTPLMSSCAASYAYTTGVTNLSVTLTGLAHGKTYTLALYGAGSHVGEGTAFTIVGASTYWVHTVGINRMISDGAGNAYTVVDVVASSTGTLVITTKPGSVSYAVMNGFQLALGAVTPNTTMTPITPTPITVWGVCGHPTCSDYASWIPANVTTQMSDLTAVGAGYYRVSFQGAEYPSYLDKLAPQAMAAGITLLPDLPVSFTPSSNAQTNYSNNYTIGYTWAAYAIAQGYPMPYWELGNEPENGSCVSVIGDGSSPADFPDETPGGFVAIASGLDGAHDGIKQAYADGRAAGTTTLTPKILVGMCYRHWGLLARIQNYNGGLLPCDIISWHWYDPSYGDFNTPCSAPGQADDGRAPAACLADFKSATDPTKPMDVWITETNRSQIISGQFYNGSTASLAAPQTGQDWTAEATVIQTTVDSFKKAANVKGVFVYELYDETIADGTSTSLLASQGYFGLITGLGGTRKNAFTTFQAEINAAK